MERNTQQLLRTFPLSLRERAGVRATHWKADARPEYERVSLTLPSPGGRGEEGASA